MKKALLVISILMLITSLASAQISTVWERNIVNSNVPSWMGASTERGLAAGKIGDNYRVVVASRNAGTIKVLDAFTGADIEPATAFDMSGVTGGTFALNDVEITEDGKIILCNLATNTSTSAFKLYVWDVDGGAPVATYSLPLTAASHRLGDVISVSGSWDAGTVIVWAAASGLSEATIYKIKTEDQGSNWTVDEVVLSGAYTNTVSAAGVAPTADGGFYLAGIGAQPRKHDAAGAYVGNSLLSSTTSSRGACVAFTSFDDEYVAFYNYRAHDDAANGGDKIGRASVRNVTDPANTNFYVETPLQGTADLYGSTNGDVAVFANDASEIHVVVLSVEQGLGCYKLDLFVPVELTSFTANAIDGSVNLAWNTASETNNKGFAVERNIGDGWTELGFVDGNGTTTEATAYNFTDMNVAIGSVEYRLKQVDFDGSYTYSAVIEVEVGAPAVFELAQNFPNPFNPSTNIQFTLPAAANVKLTVFNILGQEISTLVNSNLEAGIHSYNFDAANLNSGMYIYKIEAGDFTATRKMMLMK